MDTDCTLTENVESKKEATFFQSEVGTMMGTQCEENKKGVGSKNSDCFCVICGTSFNFLVIKQEIAEEERFQPETPVSPPIEWTKDESAILHWLLKWFSVKLSKESIWNSGVDVFPFCMNCKFELKILVDTQLKLKELEESLKNGIRELKTKIDLSEQKFNSCKIYRKDWRYRKVRVRIRRDKGTPLLSNVRRRPGRPKFAPVDCDNTTVSTQKVDLNNSVATSRSGRKLTPVSRFNAGLQEEGLLDWPKVVLSADDKHKAEQHCLIKADPEPLMDLDDSIGSSGILQSGRKRTRTPTNIKEKEKVVLQNEVVKTSMTTDREVLEDTLVQEDEKEEETKYKKKFKKKHADGNYYSDDDFILSEPDVVNIESSEDDNDDGSDIEDLLPPDKRKRGRKPKKKDEKAPKKKRVLRKNHLCSICQKPCYSRWQVGRHEWTHLSQEEKDAVASRGELPKYVATPKFQCDECGMEFTNRNNMTKHKASIHCPKGEEFKELCPLCGKSYKELGAHMKEVHSEKKEYPCGLCGKIYQNKRGRTQHKQTVHMQLSKFICKMCPKPRGFFSKYSYEQHVRAHLDIRPFQCDKCPSAFTIKAVLERHRRKFHEEGGNPRRPAYIRGRTKNAKFGQMILSSLDSCEPDFENQSSSCEPMEKAEEWIDEQSQ